MSATEARQLSREELAAWRGFLRVHARLVHELDHELLDEHGLPLSEYEVLLRLEEAPEGRRRMSELASSVLLTQSGITRLVDRLERDGLVRRVPCVEDRRGQWAVLTEAGRVALQEARVTHLMGVRARFLSRLDEDELASLARLWEALVPGSAT